MSDFVENIADLISLILRNHVFRIDPDLDHAHAGAWVSILEIGHEGEVCCQTLDGGAVFSIRPCFLRRSVN